MPTILIVDDEPEIIRIARGYLEQAGFRVVGVGNGRDALAAFRHDQPDLLILDLNLPAPPGSPPMDGLDVARAVRQTSGPGANTPIIMLTARVEETDRIVGLELGADDYLPKPFNPRELLARAKAVLRRSTGLPVGASAEPGPGRGMTFDGWRLDIAKRELWSPDNVLVQLSAGEFDLLVAFVEHPQRVLTRDQLLDLARGRSAMPFDRSIDVQVSRLRRKIEPDPKEPTMIKTVRSGGYIFTSAVTGA
jgi:two-component system OmpR family response regulator